MTKRKMTRKGRLLKIKKLWEEMDKLIDKEIEETKKDLKERRKEESK